MKADSSSPCDGETHQSIVHWVPKTYAEIICYPVFIWLLMSRRLCRSRQQVLETYIHILSLLVKFVNCAVSWWVNKKTEAKEYDQHLSHWRTWKFDRHKRAAVYLVICPFFLLSFFHSYASGGLESRCSISVEESKLKSRIKIIYIINH